VLIPRRAAQVSGYAVSMLLLCAIFALLTVGFVIPCVIDIAMTPGNHFYVPSKQTWLIVAVAFSVFGAAAWLLVGRRDVRMRAACDDVSDGLMFGDDGGLWSSPSRRTGLRDRSGIRRRERHQTTTAPRFVAPDDNPGFLLELDRRIRDWREDA
jgi:hypothetical protein